MKHLTAVLAILILAGGLYVFARLHRYEVTIGGGTRYYSVIKLDRWTGACWKLDNNGVDWNPIESSEH